MHWEHFFLLFLALGACVAALGALTIDRGPSAGPEHLASLRPFWITSALAWAALSVLAITLRGTRVESRRRFARIALIVLGVALIQHAPQSRLPLALHLIGWISVAAALILAVIPHRRFSGLIRWLLHRFGDYARWGAAVALVFAVF